MDYELYHWGILGMKWGVRRYQNKDGTLTEAGKKRYDKAKRTIDELEGGHQATKNKEAAKPTLKQKVNKMTDEELQAAVNRLTNEKRYKELYDYLNPPPKDGFWKTRLKNLTSDFIDRKIPKITDDLMDKIKKDMEAEKAKEKRDVLLKKAKGMTMSQLIAETDKQDRMYNYIDVMNGKQSRYKIDRDSKGNILDKGKNNNSGQIGQDVIDFIEELRRERNG